VGLSVIEQLTENSSFCRYLSCMGISLHRVLFTQ